MFFALQKTKKKNNSGVKSIFKREEKVTSAPDSVARRTAVAATGRDHAPRCIRRVRVVVIAACRSRSGTAFFYKHTGAVLTCVPAGCQSLGGVFRISLKEGGGGIYYLTFFSPSTLNTRLEGIISF